MEQILHLAVVEGGDSHHLFTSFLFLRYGPFRIQSGNRGIFLNLTYQAVEEVGGATAWEVISSLVVIVEGIGCLYRQASGRGALVRESAAAEDDRDGRGS